MRFTAVAAIALVAGFAGADEVVWSNLDNADPFYNVGPSVWLPGGSEDKELADDFFHVGTVTRVIWWAYGGNLPTYGGWVRFYERTEDGQVGAMLYEEFVEFSTPNGVDIELPVAFEATGWHFVSVQVHNSGAYWYPNRANVGAPTGTPIQWKDDNGDGTWGPFKGEFGNLPPHNMDLACELWGVPAGPGQIDALSAPALDRSERIVVTGAGFGDGESGELLIDGIPAIVTKWSPSRIVGYVPEASSLGTVDVIVSTPIGESDPVALDVTARTQEGQVRWRFAAESDYMNHVPGIGPDGEVYVNDLNGRLYALTGDGGLMWIVDALRGQVGGSSEGPVVVGPDGTVYVAVNPLGPTVELVAYNPDGSLKWVHTDPNAKTVGAGPTIGPDGDVYICFEGAAGAPEGLVRLTTDGDVVWNNPGDPWMWEQGGTGAEITFAPDHLGGEALTQAVMTFDLASARRVYAFDLEDGHQRFAVQAATLDSGGQTQIVAGIDGTLLMPEFVGVGGAGWGLQAFDPSDGSRMWRFDPGVASGISNARVGVDGAYYTTWDLLRTSRVTPGGQEVWRHVPDEGIHSSATPSPSNDLLIVPGAPTFGVSGWIKALDIETGNELFVEQLADENGGHTVPGSKVLFTDDGATAFLPVDILGDPPGSQYCYMYAIATGEAGGCPGDFNGDGALNILDFVAFQNAFTAGEPEADCDANGALNILDFVCFQNEFSAGCP